MMKTVQVLALCMAAALSLPVHADKPEWAGNGGKNEAPGQVKVADEKPANGYFSSYQIQAVHSYYGKQFKAGNCPPGLAKKNNGCMPPGQAKKWARGQPLNVLSDKLPAELLRELGTPPQGYKYVRVAADILLIAIGTKLVVDAIEDIGSI